jgi:hypothetical protein
MGNPSGVIDKISNIIDHFMEKPQYLPGIKQPLPKRINPLFIPSGDCLPIDLSVV